MLVEIGKVFRCVILTGGVNVVCGVVRTCLRVLALVCEAGCFIGGGGGMRNCGERTGGLCLD